MFRRKLVGLFGSNLIAKEKSMIALSRKTEMDGDEETYRHSRKDTQAQAGRTDATGLTKMEQLPSGWKVTKKEQNEPDE